jgi:hypothetical protein
LLNQLAAFALVINLFLLPPVLFIEYILNPCIQRGDSSSLFCVHISTFSLEQGAHRLFITTDPGIPTLM